MGLMAILLGVFTCMFKNNVLRKTLEQHRPGALVTLTSVVPASHYIVIKTHDSESRRQEEPATTE